MCLALSTVSVKCQCTCMCELVLPFAIRMPECFISLVRCLLRNPVLLCACLGVHVASEASAGNDASISKLSRFL